MKLTYRSRL